jgi:hypothetical protein
MKLLQLKRFLSQNSFIEINGGRRHATCHRLSVVCSRSLSQQSRPIGPSMTLGNMREL